MEAERHSVRVEKVVTKRKAEAEVPKPTKLIDTRSKAYTSSFTLTSATLMKFY